MRSTEGGLAGGRGLNQTLPCCVIVYACLAKPIGSAVSSRRNLRHFLLLYPPNLTSGSMQARDATSGFRRRWSKIGRICRVRHQLVRFAKRPHQAPSIPSQKHPIPLDPRDPLRFRANHGAWHTEISTVPFNNKLCASARARPVEVGENPCVLRKTCVAPP